MLTYVHLFWLSVQSSWFRNLPSIGGRYLVDGTCKIYHLVSHLFSDQKKAFVLHDDLRLFEVFLDTYIVFRSPIMIHHIKQRIRLSQHINGHNVLEP